MGSLYSGRLSLLWWAIHILVGHLYSGGAGLAVFIMVGCLYSGLSSFCLGIFILIPCLYSAELSEFLCGLSIY